MTATTAPGATEALARFASSLRRDQLPDELVHALKRHVLDQLGVQLACTVLPWVQVTTRYALEHGKEGAATVVGTDRHLDAEQAAFANSVSGHGFELDDSAGGASAHPGCICVPTVLAVGEELGSTGMEALMALAVGFESITRIGVAVTPSLLLHRGFHETCVEGVFAAVLCSGRLMGFSAEQFIGGMGIAGSHSSGTLEYTQSGGEVKRLHAGLGSMGGIRSARLAAYGFTAPRAILEGKRGVLQAFCESYRTEAITDTLGEYWEFAARASLKVYSCAGGVGAQIEAAQAALKQSGRTTADIEEILVGLDRKSMSMTGTIGPRPNDMTGAQFSSHFSVGLALAKGDAGMETYLEAGDRGFRDPEVLALTERVRVELDPECDAEYMGSPQRWLGKVAIRFTDGTVSEAKTFRRGTPTNPLSDAEVEAKFLSLAVGAVGEQGARRIIEAVQDLENLASVRDLTKLLAGDALVAPHRTQPPAAS